MPSIQSPSKRVLADEREYVLMGRRVKVYTHNEKYRTLPFTSPKRGRHIRAEVPNSDGHIHIIHDRRIEQYWRRELPSAEAHREELLDRVIEYIEEENDLSAAF